MASVGSRGGGSLATNSSSTETSWSRLGIKSHPIDPKATKLYPLADQCELNFWNPEKDFLRNNQLGSFDQIQDI